jgi:hypothetical protein
MTHHESDAKPQPSDFYTAAVVDEAAELVAAYEVEGFDQELALLRRAIKQKKDDFDTLRKGTELVVRAVAARYRMSPQSAHDLASSMEETIRRLADQMFPQDV